MDQLLEAIRAAVADQASDDARAAGAQACRTILAALEAKAGEPLAVAPIQPVDPSTAAQMAQLIGALRNVPAEQLLDLAIARLRAVIPAEKQSATPAPLKFHIVRVPGGRK